MRPARRNSTTWLAGPVVAASVLLALTASTTSASCAEAPVLRDALKTAPVAFVGTVAGTSNEARWATVTVEEIWAGPNQPGSVVVRGGPANGASSVDRTFEVGTRYLFLPSLDASGALVDNSCSATTVLTADVEALRPADARPPSGGQAAAGFDVGALLGPVVVVAVVAIALLLVGVAARGRAD